MIRIKLNYNQLEISCGLAEKNKSLSSLSNYQILFELTFERLSSDILLIELIVEL